MPDSSYPLRCLKALFDEFEFKTNMYKSFRYLVLQKTFSFISNFSEPGFPGSEKLGTVISRNREWEKIGKLDALVTINIS